MNNPSTTELNGNGRDHAGRFAAGNTAAKGNPFNKRVAELRAVLYAGVSDGDLAEVVAQLVTQAKQGVPWAVRELFDRLLGRPSQALALTGGDGEGLGFGALTAIVLEVLGDEPEVKAKVAAKLLEVSRGRAG